MNNLRDKLNAIITSKNYLSLQKIADSPYQMQAIDFLYKTKTTCNIELVGKTYPDWDKKNLHNEYRVTLKNSKHTYVFSWYDSIQNTSIKPKLSTNDFYSVLAGLGFYYPENFDDFCSEFGYEFENESEYIKAKQVHLSCLDQDKQLKKLFTSEELEQLADIN